MMVYDGFIILPKCLLDGASESLTWITDIQTGYSNGVEYRTPYRDQPMQEINLSYFSIENKAPEMISLLKNAIRRKFLLPLVWEKEFIRVDNTSQDLLIESDDFISSPLRFSDGGYILLVRGDFEKVFKLIQVGGAFQVNEVFEFKQGDELISLREGYIQNDVSANIYFNGINPDITFKVKKPSIFNYGNYGVKLLNGEDYYAECLLLNGDSVSATYTSGVNYIESDFGYFQDFHYEVNRNEKSFRLVSKGYESINLMKRWFQRRLGRMNPFLMPTYENNYIITGINPFYIDVERNYDDFNLKQKFITIKDSSGWNVLNVSEYIVGANSVRISLESEFIPDGDILRISDVSLFRLNTDRVEFEYSQGIIAQTSVRVMEVYDGLV